MTLSKYLKASPSDRNEKIWSTITAWLFYLVAFTLPYFRAHWNSKLVILLTLVSLFRMQPKVLWHEIKSSKIFWLFVSLFLLDVIGLAHTENMSYGLRYVETKSPLLLLPILILINRKILTKEIIHNICKSLIAGVFLVLLGYMILITMDILKNNFQVDLIINERLSNVPAIANQTTVDIHPSFLSLYISFCILFLIVNLKSTESKIHNWLSATVLVILLLFQFWLNSRAGLIGLVACLIFLAFFKSSPKVRLLGILIIAIIIASLLLSPITRERFISAPLRALTHTADVDANDPATWPISFRLQIMDCSLSILKNNHWIWGYGTGDFRDKINECFKEKEYGWLIVRDFDAHNEYLSQMHRHGISGLLLMGACFLTGLLSGYRQKNTLYITFIILMIVSCFPETLLSSQKGVVFYALFNSLFFLGGRSPATENSGI